MVRYYTPEAVWIVVTVSMVGFGWQVLLCSFSVAEARSSTTHVNFSKQIMFSAHGHRKAPGIRADLIHPDHVDSPFRNAEELTAIARIRSNVIQTAAREEFLQERFKLKKNLPTEIAGVGRKPLETPSRELVVDHPIPFRDNPIRLPTGRDLSRVPGYESTVSVTGAGYSMRIAIGTPPQYFTAFADTGSDLAWIQCSPCDRCFLQDEPFFDPALSSTYESVSCSSRACEDLQQWQNFAGCDPHCTTAGCNPSCQYEYEYGDQTHSKGDMAVESLTLSTTNGGIVTVPGFLFGCGHENTGSLNQTGASGIIGLGRGQFSFPSQLKPYIGAKFSTCFVDREAAVVKTSPLLFGEMASPLPLLPIQYTPMLSGNNSVDAFYYINLEGISVGARRVPLDHWKAELSIDPSTGQGGTILDSGSTLTSLVAHLYSSVMKEFLAQAPAYPRIDFASNGLDLCFVVTNVDKPVLPTLTFHLTGATWTMPKENVAIIFRDGEGGVYMCAALTKSKYSMNILGNIQQQNFRIIYDMENERIGFQEARCDQT